MQQCSKHQLIWTPHDHFPMVYNLLSERYSYPDAPSMTVIPAFSLDIPATARIHRGRRSAPPSRSDPSDYLSTVLASFISALSFLRSSSQCYVYPPHKPPNDDFPIVSGIGTIPLADPRQRVADEHVYHAGAAELGVHDDHARRLLAHLADDLGLLATLGIPESLEGGVRGFGGYDGEELAFVGDVERVYAQDLARPVARRP